MIHSILDNDLYKFTMQLAVVKKFPRAKVRFEFINRGKDPFPEGFAEELRRQVFAMQNLQLSLEEKLFLEGLYFLEPTYIDFLQGYRYNPGEVGIVQKGNELSVSIEGYWYRTILWEVPLMALISELYFKMTGKQAFADEEVADIARKKAVKYKMLGVQFADFGTRRRYSHYHHNLIIESLKTSGGKNFIGTSNVHFAQKYGLKAIGTHAHEWFMFHAAKYGFKSANKTGLENWVNIFRGDLGIALSDTFTTETFFRSFDTKFAKLFDGVRHDSGDPLAFADKTISHYESLRIDPTTKSIVFSDGLNPEMVETIEKHCRGRIRTSYGIGTNFTNDVGVKPLNIVIKMTAAKPEGQEYTPTVKLSDVAGKHTGDEDTVELAKRVLGIL